MDIYVGHSSTLNYKKNLYQPIKDSKLSEKHNIVLPHENSDKQFNSREYLENKCDILIAEVSNPSTGLGIELGWAKIYEVPIICVHTEESDPSSSISKVTDRIKRYQDSEELVEIIEKSISKK